MPWRCNQCSVEIDADSVVACPACGAAKTAWTLVQDRTRRLRVGAKRFICERGDAAAPVDAPLPVIYDAATWTLTEVAPAIPTAEARRLAAASQGPAPRDVLRVVQHTGAGKPGPVRLTPLPEARAAESSDHEARSDAPHDARFLLVFGEPPDGLSFEGLEVIDVTDDTTLGHAPQLEVVALKKSPVVLTIERRAGPEWDVFAFSLHHPEEEQAAPPADAPAPEWDVFAFSLHHPEEEQAAPPADAPAPPPQD